MSRWSSVLRTVVRTAVELERTSRPRRSAAADRTVRAGRRRMGSLRRRLSYAPQADGAADPGEVVWAGVAYEDQPDVVKDRPVLVVGRQDDHTVLGLMLSSQQHRAADANWLAVGSGPWDREGRASFVRLDRVLPLAEDGIRREGAVLAPARFARVAEALRTRYGWE